MELPYRNKKRLLCLKYVFRVNKIDKSRNKKKNKETKYPHKKFIYRDICAIGKIS